MLTSQQAIFRIIALILFCLTFGFASQTAAAQVNGLVSHWPGEGNANDVEGSNNGTLLNGAGYTQGVIGQAFSFDGVDDLFEATTAGLPTGNSDRTLAMWVKVDASVTTEAFFGGYGNFGALTQAYSLGENSSGIFVTQWGTGIGGPTLQPGTWHHVAATNVGNNLVLYLDGNIVGQTNVPINTLAGTQFFSGRIPGANGDIRRLQGTVDEIRVYDRSLSQSEIQSLSIIDSTPPVITPIVTGPLGDNGWYTADVEVSWSISDPESTVSSSTGCETVETTADTSGVILTCSVTSAGGTDSQSVTIKRDSTAPSTSCGAADGSWHAANVSVACSASDAFSGLSLSGYASFSLSTSVLAGSETANAATGSLLVCDSAGNCTTAGPIAGNKVDRKSPTITITTPTNAMYVLNQSVSASFACQDGGSTVATCTGSVVNGADVDTASAGSKTFTVLATDNVGNSASPTSVSYTIGFGIRALYDQTRAVKSGSTIPIKIQLVDALARNVSSTSVVVHAVSLVQISTTAAEAINDAGTSNPDANFRFDSSLGDSGGYIFNLKTTGLSTGTYRLGFTVDGNPAMYAVQFAVRQ